jgi:hypothetical protein
MYENRFFTFFDILGFSNAITKTMKNGKENKRYTEKINAFIEDIQKRLDYTSRVGDFEKIKTGIVFNQFSDSVIISYPMIKHALSFLISDIIFIYVAAIQYDFLLRGTVVYDKIYHTEKKVFGPAMVKAYNMERKMAIYPRVILDDVIVTKYSLKIPNFYCVKEDMGRIGKYSPVTYDSDGLYYVNFINSCDIEGFYNDLTENFRKIRSIIKKMENENDISIRSKYLWLKEKFIYTIYENQNIFNENEEERKRYPTLYKYCNNKEIISDL